MAQTNNAESCKKTASYDIATCNHSTPQGSLQLRIPEFAAVKSKNLRMRQHIRRQKCYRTVAYSRQPSGSCQRITLVSGDDRRCAIHFHIPEISAVQARQKIVIRLAVAVHAGQGKRNGFADILLAKFLALCGQRSHQSMNDEVVSAISPDPKVSTVPMQPAEN